MTALPEVADAEDHDGDDAGLGRAIEAKLAAAARVEPEPANPVTPVEEGPRRKLLTILAAAVALVLVWLLFRSVPEQRSGADAAEQPAKSEAVEDLANASDPSWMNADPARRTRVADPSSVVPPVYPYNGQAPTPSDTTGVIAGAAPGGVAGEGQPQPGDPGAEQPAEDPRRQAFLSALRSRPLQSSASGAAAAGDPADPAEVPAPPSLSEMQEQAEAEAAQRSAYGAPADGGFSARTAGPTPGGITSTSTGGPPVSPSPYRASDAGEAPQAAAPHLMLGRGARARDEQQLVVPVGSVIEGQLHTAVVSDVPGQVVGMVVRNVYDAGQRTVVVPMYSWLIGTYDSDVVAGQPRLVVQWTAIRFPDGRTFDLPALRASDRAGASGLPGRVNNHYGRVFGHAVLSSVIAAAFVGRADDGNSAARSTRESIAEAAAQQLGQTASEVTRRNLNIKPTIRVPRLTRFSIVLDRDLVFTRPARE